jgi:hypothetical protein
MTNNSSMDLSRRLYSALLKLYPRDFSGEFGSAMMQLFTDQCRCAVRESGTRGMVFLWLRTISDLIGSVPREHLASPRASLGLLEAVPNKPLPWKGVALVMIPCLLFFAGQIGTLAGEDWFFTFARRAAYYLIVPVLLVWFVQRKFPIWGLIPLGIFYRTLFDVSYRVKDILESSIAARYESPLSLSARFWKTIPEVLRFFARMLIWLQKYEDAIKILAAVMLGSAIVFLVVWLVRRRSFSAGAWICTMGLLAFTVLEIYSGIITYVGKYKWSWDRMLGYRNWMHFLQNAKDANYTVLADAMGFVLLILIGAVLARRHGRLAMLLPLGYIIPTVILGRFDYSPDMPFFLIWAGTSVLIYRMLVTLVAPIWIVRSASEGKQLRAGAVGLLVAVGLIVITHTWYTFAFTAPDWAGWEGVYLYFSISPELILAAGMVMALLLYKKPEPAQTATGLEPVGAVT